MSKRVLTGLIGLIVIMGRLHADAAVLTTSDQTTKLISQITSNLSSLELSKGAAIVTTDVVKKCGTQCLKTAANPEAFAGCIFANILAEMSTDAAHKVFDETFSSSHNVSSKQGKTKLLSQAFLAFISEPLIAEIAEIEKTNNIVDELLKAVIKSSPNGAQAITRQEAAVAAFTVLENTLQRLDQEK